MCIGKTKVSDNWQSLYLLEAVKLATQQYIHDNGIAVKNRLSSSSVELNDFKMNTTRKQAAKLPECRACVIEQKREPSRSQNMLASGNQQDKSLTAVIGLVRSMHEVKHAAF